jgi:glycogen(starch) synthase
VPGNDVGLRLRSRDPRALAEMMQFLLDDGALRERLVAEASVHVRRFDWNDVARRTAQVYDELAGPQVGAAAVALRPA